MITFKTKNHANVMMFNAVAHELMELMGVRQIVPGIIEQEDVEQVLHTLQKAVQALPTEHDYEYYEYEEEHLEEQQEPPISLKLRAIPLIELLTSARNNNRAVTWE
uniref:DUF1840 domain-containing protein n=1 Tax=Thaumasiovibrio occultus TaxID=1891184 RepID=UPI000B34FD4E|nr:DUF1840 family protein [Thaumasiovibrio occultus]